MNLENKKKIVSSWFDFLQTQICTEFEKFEKKFSKKKFISKRWKKGKKNPPRSAGFFSVLSTTQRICQTAIDRL